MRIALVVIALAGCSMEGGEDVFFSDPALDVRLFCEATSRGVACEATPVSDDGVEEQAAFDYDWTASGNLTFNERVTLEWFRELICVSEGLGAVRVTVTDELEDRSSAAVSIPCRGGHIEVER